MKKKYLLAVMLLVSMLCVLTGCKKDKPIAIPFGQSDIDILTYEKVDYSKTQLVVSITGNINFGYLNSEFEKKHPEIQIIQTDLTGGNNNYLPIGQVITEGDAPDIMISACNLIPDNLLENYFVDLSTNPITSRFQTATLNSISVNERHYSLPGLSKLSAIAYNKTLFEQNNWSVPKTLDEFIALVNIISSTTEIDPFNPNAKYDAEVAALLTGFCYGDVFAGVENRAWYKDFINGDATFVENADGLFDVIQKFIDNDVIIESDYKYSATARGNEFVNGEIAMMNYKVINYDSDIYEFSYFPFPGSSADEEGWVMEELDSEIAVPKKGHTDAELDAINKYLDFYASEEGQNAFIGKNALTSNLKSEYISDDNLSDSYNGIMGAIEAGNKFSPIKFADEDTYLSVGLAGETLAMIKGERTAAQSIRHIDETCRNTWVNNPPTVLATAAEDFTILDVSYMFADMFREETGADIGLITNNVAYRGNLMRIYKGDITDVMAKVLLPRSYANNSKLIKVKMTGAQLLAALNDPLGSENKTANCTYAFSGLKCTVAAWNDVGEKMVSVTLTDGTAIDNQKFYTVACWEGTIFDKYITETVETYGNYNNSSTEPDDSFVALLTKYLTKVGTITPARDGRATLKWD